MSVINSKIPEGPLAQKWTNYKANQKLVNPSNKRKIDVIVVGTGLAGAAAAASLGEMGFKVKNFTIQDFMGKLVALALEELGKDNITQEIIEMLRAKLTEKQKRRIIYESRYVTVWIHDFLKDILQ